MALGKSSASWYAMAALQRKALNGWALYAASNALAASANCFLSKNANPQSMWRRASSTEPAHGVPWASGAEPSTTSGEARAASSTTRRRRRFFTRAAM